MPRSGIIPPQVGCLAQPGKPGAARQTRRSRAAQAQPSKLLKGL